MTDNIFEEYVALRSITYDMLTAYTLLTDLDEEEYLTSEQKAELRVIASDLCALFTPMFNRRGDLAVRLTKLAEEVKE